MDLNSLKTHEYIKDFDAWNKRKQEIDKKDVSNSFYYHEREIWWSSIGVNVGYEMDGKNDLFERPILVVKKINKNQFFGIPLTSKEKNGYFYMHINYSNNLGYGIANFSQMRVFSSKRLLRKIGMAEKKDFTKLKNKLLEFIS